MQSNKAAVMKTAEPLRGCCVMAGCNFTRGGHIGQSLEDIFSQRLSLIYKYSLHPHYLNTDVLVAIVDLFRPSGRLLTGSK